MNMQFISTLAWVLGVAATGLLMLRIYGMTTYSEHDELRDALKNQRVTFPMLWPAITATVCWVWIITA